MTNSPDGEDPGRMPDGLQPPSAAHAIASTTLSRWMPAPSTGSSSRARRAGSSLEPGVWHQISRKYVWVQLISTGSVFLIVVAATLVLTLVVPPDVGVDPGRHHDRDPRVEPGDPARARRARSATGCAKTTSSSAAASCGSVSSPCPTVACSSSTSPTDRSTADSASRSSSSSPRPQSTGVTIPGLEQTTAETLRDHLVAVAESRRTGL